MLTLKADGVEDSAGRSVGIDSAGITAGPVWTVGAGVPKVSRFGSVGAGGVSGGFSVLVIMNFPAGFGRPFWVPKETRQCA